MLSFDYISRVRGRGLFGRGVSTEYFGWVSTECFRWVRTEYLFMYG